MAESDEARKRRWAAAAAKSYMTPSMAHALNMSKQQSVNKYKEKFDKTKGKGFTAVVSTPQIEHAKKQSTLVSQNKYKSDFEKNKAKFTSVADDPETIRVTRVGNQISNTAYHGKGSAVSKSRRKRHIEATAPLTEDKTKNNASPQKHMDEETETTPRCDEASTEIAIDEYANNDASCGNDTVESRSDDVSGLRNNDQLSLEYDYEQRLANDVVTLRTECYDEPGETSKPVGNNQSEDYQPAGGNQSEEYEPVGNNQSEEYQPVENDQSEEYEQVESNQSEEYEPVESNQSEEYEPVESNQSEECEPVQNTINQSQKCKPIDEISQPKTDGIPDGSDIEDAQVDDSSQSNEHNLTGSSLDDFYANLA